MERGGGGGYYIFSILIYIVEYVTVAKLNTIRLKPKTSGSLRNTWKCVKSMICAIPRNREIVTFRRLLHINRYFFRENIALTILIPFIRNNLVFLFLLICRFWLFYQFYSICTSNSLKKQDFNKIKGLDIENGWQMLMYNRFNYIFLVLNFLPSYLNLRTTAYRPACNGL